MKSLYIVLSAPSGAGKTTIAKRLADRHRDMVISVSATTRPRRPRERDGVDYHFLSEDEFKAHIRQNDFVEYEQVHGEYYGTLKPEVDAAIAAGNRVIFDIDVNGALAIRDRFPDAVLIFIKPPSLVELRRRLENRKSEDPEAIERRLQRIDYEYGQADKFDHVVINDDLMHTVYQIEDILEKES